MAGKTATAADGMHPTGMHSCLGIASVAWNMDSSKLEFGKKSLDFKCKLCSRAF